MLWHLYHCIGGVNYQGIEWLLRQVNYYFILRTLSIPVELADCLVQRAQNLVLCLRLAFFHTIGLN